MKSSAILDQLRAHVREEQAHDEALERLARGDQDARSELERVSAEDPELAAIVAVARPREGASARIAARLAREPSRSQGRVLVFARRAAIVVAPLAVAAAVALQIGRTRTAELPVYVAEATAESVTRGPGDDARQSLALGDAKGRFEVRVRPSTPLRGSVVAFAFLRSARGLTPLEAAVDVSESGAVRLRGRSSDLVEGAVVVVVGTAAGLPDAEVARALAQGGKDVRGARVVVVPVTR